jgi:hypothetical protein
VEAGWNTSTVVPASRTRLQKGNPVPEVVNPVPVGYKYGDLALQVGGVSDETVKFGYGFYATLTSE